MATPDNSTPSFGVSSIYVIEVVDAGVVKVGKADDPKIRLATLQGANHHELRIAYAVEVPKPRVLLIERQAHGNLSHSHIRGEHFRASVEEAIAAVDRAIRAAASWPAGPRDGIERPRRRIGRPPGKAVFSFGNAEIPKTLYWDVQTSIMRGDPYSRREITSFFVQKGIPYSGALAAAKKMIATFASVAEPFGRGRFRIPEGTSISSALFLPDIGGPDDSLAAYLKG